MEGGYSLVVVLGLAYPVGSRTWWMVWVLVLVLAVLGVVGLLVLCTRRH